MFTDNIWITRRSNTSRSLVRLGTLPWINRSRQFVRGRCLLGGAFHLVGDEHMRGTRRGMWGERNRDNSSLPPFFSFLATLSQPSQAAISIWEYSETDILLQVHHHLAISASSPESCPLPSPDDAAIHDWNAPRRQATDTCPTCHPSAPTVPLRPSPPPHHLLSNDNVDGSVSKPHR